MIVHNFPDSNRVGKQGEKIIRKYFESCQDIIHYEDVSDKKEYQDQDIDGILWRSTGDKGTVELKTDKYTTNRIFYETDSCVERHTPGCMNKTKAEYLYYYFPGYGCMYRIKMNEYREWFEENKKEFTSATFQNKSKFNGSIYHSRGRLIPLPWFEQNFAHWEKIPMPKVHIT